MAQIVHNTTVITPIGDRVQTLRRHSLVFEGGRVTELRPAAEFAERVAQHEFDTIIAGERYLLIPGLINVHHHLYQSLTRCLPAAQNIPLFPWLLTLYEYWRDLDYESARLAAQVSLAELVLSGCTTTSDHFYMFPPASNVRLEAVLEAADEIGIRIHVCRGSMTLGKSGGGLPPDDCVESDAAVLADYLRVLDKFHDAAPFSRQRIDLAPCSPFNVTRELMRDTRALARERGVLLHTHLAETLDEQSFCLERYDCRPVQYLADLDWLGPDVYLAHCVWLNPDEIRLLAQTRTAAAHCPTSNMRLGSGIAPIEQMLAAGMRVGLGVDGASSQDGGNLLHELKLALLSARVRTAVRPDETPAATGATTSGGNGHAAEGAGGFFTAAAALRLATTGGAACLNRPELGHLAPGAAADFALIDAGDIRLAGAVAQDPLAALVLCDAPRPQHVYIAGRQIVRDGQLTMLDQSQLAAKMNALVATRFTVRP